MRHTGFLRCTSSWSPSRPWRRGTRRHDGGGGEGTRAGHAPPSSLSCRNAFAGCLPAGSAPASMARKRKASASGAQGHARRDAVPPTQGPSSWVGRYPRGCRGERSLAPPMNDWWGCWDAGMLASFPAPRSMGDSRGCGMSYHFLPRRPSDCELSVLIAISDEVPRVLRHPGSAQ